MINSAYNEEDRSEDFSVKLTLFLIVIAYVFSLGMRMIWVYQSKDISAFHWNGELMINTNDGYYFASAVQHLLDHLHTANPQIPTAIKNYPAMIYLSAFFASVLPVSLDTVILYLPAFVSSLIVIPVILLGRLFGLTQVGFFAALIASIGWSYYNRTMTGYYDSDMFAVLMQYFILFALLATVVREKLSYAALAFLLIATYPYFYPQGMALLFAMYLVTAAVFLLFHRREPFAYVAIAIVGLALVQIPIYFKIPLAIVLIWLYQTKTANIKQWVLIGAVAGAAVLFLSDLSSLIVNKLSVYLERGVEHEGLRFYQVSQTVREAGSISFETMANRISGSQAAVIAALAGYLLLVFRQKWFVVALPLVAIGVFSLWGGLRFTVYAVPIAAFSVVFLFYVISGYIENRVGKIVLIGLLTGAVLYPNVQHIRGYKVPTVFNAEEVAVLDRLSKTGSDKDYVIAWWDYGYPIWYYANKNTLIDGGKHHHDNFIVSEILTTNSPLEAARLSRIAVETYVQSGYKKIADTMFRNKQPEQLDPNAFLETLRYGDVQLPETTRNVYLYLPLRMMDIFPTVAVFSNLDLNSGQAYRQPFFYATSRFRDSTGTIDLGRGIVIDKQNGVVRLGQQEIPLKAMYRVNVLKDGSVKADPQLLHMNGTLSLIYMASYGKFLLVDDKMFNSTFVQMFVLGKYDSELFEPVINSPWVRVYKLKV